MLEQTGNLSLRKINQLSEKQIALFLLAFSSFFYDIYILINFALEKFMFN